MNTALVNLTVNGKPVDAQVETRVSLADFLRHQCRLTGTHVGCEHGVCGACTVLVDGKSTRACLMLAIQADSRSVHTVESLADGATLNALQQAFADHHALQCGFCTSGMLMTLTELLRESPAPDEAQVRVALSGNICRCTGYQNIVAATLDAAAKLRANGGRS
jgi:carbon-monoxide dehydrogenase small subunit